MPDIKYVEASLALTKDESKTLGLTLGTKNVTAGEKIPKAGKASTQYPSIEDCC
jgi:phosphatidylethanolamine-binding protein